jgi:hypothetical protein
MNSYSTLVTATVGIEYLCRGHDQLVMVIATTVPLALPPRMPTCQGVTWRQSCSWRCLTPNWWRPPLGPTQQQCSETSWAPSALPHRTRGTKGLRGPHLFLAVLYNYTVVYIRWLIFFWINECDQSMNVRPDQWMNYLSFIILGVNKMFSPPTMYTY